ncbi:MAG: M20/M25/M40 family metallo-hydrolase [candidate division WOR-3 bacterium]
MRETIDSLLAKLSFTSGVGYANEATRLFAREAVRFCKDVEFDKSGSVIARLKGRRKKEVMIATHIDEIGFVVSGIEEGFLRISPIGHFDPRLLPGQKVAVAGRKKLEGYIGIAAPHYTTPQEREKIIPISELFVDLGLPEKDVKSFVRIGDYVSFSGSYLKLEEPFRCGKAFDNRVGVVCGLMILKLLSELDPSPSINLIATTQEEWVGLGARINAYRLNPDIALVIDVTFGEQPELKDYECFPLNKGPVIGRGPTISPKIYNELIETARRLEIPYQIECLPRNTGTDADYIAFVREGILTGLVSVPVRYMHTPVEVVSLIDMERTIRLVTEFIVNLT